MDTQLNRWKLQHLWNMYSQGIDVQDLQEEILFYLEQDQQDEFWLVVEDQNEPLLIGLTDFEYGMHLQGIPKPYKERFLLWMYTYAQKNPQSMIHSICKSGMWDTDVLKICHNASISLPFWNSTTRRILVKEVQCSPRTSAKSNKMIVPHSSFSKIFIRKYLVTELELHLLCPQQNNTYASSTSLLPPVENKGRRIEKGPSDICSTLFSELLL